MIRRLARRVLRAALLAASSACHAAGYTLNRWQWRLDGIPYAHRRPRR